MVPLIKSGQLVTCHPFSFFFNIANVGDIVLCKVGRNQYLHLVKAVGSDGRYQIGNNRGHINGWINAGNIYGKVVKVED